MIVGYDAAAPTPYWKLRNSWGPEFGEDGYFRIAMNDPGAGEWGLFGMLAESVLVSARGWRERRCGVRRSPPPPHRRRCSRTPPAAVGGVREFGGPAGAPGLVDDGISGATDAGCCGFYFRSGRAVWRSDNLAEEAGLEHVC